LLAAFCSPVAWCFRESGCSGVSLPALDAADEAFPVLKQIGVDADHRLVGDDEQDHRLRDTPLRICGKEAFAFLILVAVIVALLTSVPIAVAVLAVGGLILGGTLLVRSRRS
jgi:hypothetical protein